MSKVFRLLSLGAILLSSAALFASASSFTIKPGDAVTAGALMHTLAATSSSGGVTITVPQQSSGFPSGPISDYTSILQNIFANAPQNATIQFLPGNYPVQAGTTYILRQSLKLVGQQQQNSWQQFSGPQATLINARIHSLANVSISNLGFVEQDCTYTLSNPDACPPASPMISIGGAGYPITQASISNVSLNFTRAYTGIAFGYDQTQNVSINNFTITDHELSGITVLGGNNITISNGSITGGTSSNTDDGIALSSAAGELSNVSINNVQANNTSDLAGIGAEMYFPLHDISINSSYCQQTIVCIYVKAGNIAPAPSQYSGYSQLQRLTVNGILDMDPSGTRHRSSLWIYAEGGASASDITINNVFAWTRDALAMNPMLWIFTDASSKVDNVQLSNLSLQDRFAGAASSSSRPGYPAAEGLFLQDQGSNDISDVSLTNVSINGTAYYAIDSSQATVSDLSIANSTFTNIDVAAPGLPVLLIPYPYTLNGKTVNP